MKKKKWQKLLFHLSFWLFLEIFLGYIGLDNLADYSEFLFPQPRLILSR
ncbi:hypothetical protein PN462_05220 [Spirulina sp. CS-785/01]|nr:hypothetical protein [Spirulina sp. CS-785/01]MDB9312497.1 hypothetical protein [Spirulina sp. CS-785/01]